MKTQWRVYKAQQPHFYDVYKMVKDSPRWIDLVEALDEQDALNQVILEEVRKDTLNEYIVNN